MKLLLILLSLLPISAISQNLVPNGNFEDTVQCPVTMGDLHFASFWTNPSTLGTPDFLHYCASYPVPGSFGYQIPHSGDGYGGIGLGSPGGIYREYMATPLTAPLIAGNCYHIEFYASAGHHRWTTDDIHVYFSDTTVANYPSFLFPFSPQVRNSIGNFLDSTNWTLIQGDFIANGGETFMIIGNLDSLQHCTYNILDSITPNNSGAYAYIDDVSLIEIVCTGLANDLEPQFNIFPNPVSDVLTINTEYSKHVFIIVYDMSMKQLIKTSFLKSHVVDVGFLSKGAYYYSIENSNENLYNGMFIK